MKLHATLANNLTSVEIREHGSRVLAKLGDCTYELDVRQSGDSYLLVFDGLVFDCRVDGVESGKLIDVFVGTGHYAVTLTDPKRLRSANAASAHTDGTARIIAPMPGKVVRVMVEVGAQVESGTGIVVVEAMKMQNEMKSPKAGTVVAINGEVGATVNGGDVLAVIE